MATRYEALAAFSSRPPFVVGPQPPQHGGIIVNGGGAGTLVLRMTNQPNTWTPASSSDSRDDLVGLVFHLNDKFYLPGSLIPNMSGLQAGSVYYRRRMATSPGARRHPARR